MLVGTVAPRPVQRTHSLDVGGYENMKHQELHTYLATFALATGLLLTLPIAATVIDTKTPLHPVIAATIGTLAVIFLLSAFGIYKRYNWARVLLVVLLWLPTIGLLGLTTAFCRDFMAKGKMDAMLGGLGLFLILASAFITLIRICSSETMRGEMIRTSDPQPSPSPYSSPEAGSESGEA